MQKYFADKREEKIALIKGITTGEGFDLAPLPQVLSNETKPLTSEHQSMHIDQVTATTGGTMNTSTSSCK
jgi:hypothetical protein